MGCHFLHPRDLLTPGIESGPSSLQADALTSELPGKEKNVKVSAKSQGEHPAHGEVEISGL